LVVSVLALSLEPAGVVVGAAPPGMLLVAVVPPEGIAGGVGLFGAVGRGRADDLAVGIVFLLLGGGAAVVDVGGDLDPRSAGTDDALDDVHDPRLKLGLGGVLGVLGRGG